ncbi:DUF5983 family protein [Paenibacillus shenyangensis]|uniref:DUF5983 family protein n=1 Tax=Paenibacillus sp. A9 TaxID=1284352 RepID=UPI0003821174|nr:hypothetical protein [Paenibacillus sp. A9]
MEKHNMLAISTAHIEPTVLEKMNDGENVGCIYYAKEGYGFFLPVVDLLDGSAGQLPECLDQAITLARREGCTFLMIDGDVSVIEQLPEYEHA